MNPVALALATQRLTQLVVDDELTRPVREAIDHWAATKEEFSVPERIATGLSCGYCVSIWAAAGILIANRFAVGRVLVRILALSSASLIVTEGTRRLER